MGGVSIAYIPGIKTTPAAAIMPGGKDKLRIIVGTNIAADACMSGTGKPNPRLIDGGIIPASACMGAAALIDPYFNCAKAVAGGVAGAVETCSPGFSISDSADMRGGAMPMPVFIVAAIAAAVAVIKAGVAMTFTAAM